MSLVEMRHRAEKACKGSKFIARPALIGFSNAANVLRKYAARDCKTISNYTVTVIGDSSSGAHLNNKAKACGNFKIIHPHEVPSEGVLREAILHSPKSVKAPESEKGFKGRSGAGAR